jgi:alpha-amylase
MIGQDDIVYMIVTDRFADGDITNNDDVDENDPTKRHGGDLRGIIERLPYLKDLGVTTLWLTPVYLNSRDAYHGYHPLDFERIDPHLWSASLANGEDLADDRDKFAHFVSAVHEQGLKVLFDAIICHTAPSHPWLRQCPGWFNRNQSDPKKWWIWGLPDLNHDNIDVNMYFARNLLEWIDRTGVDGVRIDAARHVESQFWHTLKLFTKGLRPDVTMLGEVWDQDVQVVAPYQAYHGFDAMFDYPLYDALIEVFARDQHFGRIARPELSDDEPLGILNQDHAYRNAYHLVTFIDNHDTPRFFHQAGGEAQPEAALARQQMALAFLLTTRGIPQLYYGSELALDGGPDPDNRRDMPWTRLDKDNQSTESARARQLHMYVQRLIAVRQASRALRYGLLTTLYVSSTVHAFARSFPGDLCIVVLNNGWNTDQLTIPLTANPRMPSVALEQLPSTGSLMNELIPDDQTELTDQGLSVQIPPKTAAIYRCP